MKSIAALFCSCLLAHAHTTLDLKVAHQTAPLGVDDAKPRLSWRMAGDTKGLANRPIRSSSPPAKQARARQGRPLGQRPGEIRQPERRLRRRSRCHPRPWIHWTVRTWAGDTASEWSKPQRFLTALIGSQPKQPSFPSRTHRPSTRSATSSSSRPPATTAAPFTPEKKSSRHRPRLRARHLRTPRQRPTRRRRLFRTGLDGLPEARLLQHLRSHPFSNRRPNAIGAIVADGWYAGYVGYGKLVGYGPHQTGRNIYGKTPALMVEIHLTYDDGSRAVIGTDTTWKTATGPELEADFLMGEAYDARKGADHVFRGHALPTHWQSGEVSRYPWEASRK
jgi:alpha-L-rhamnosidase